MMNEYFINENINNSKLNYYMNCAWKSLAAIINLAESSDDILVRQISIIDNFFDMLIDLAEALNYTCIPRNNELHDNLRKVIFGLQNIVNELEKKNKE
jgi:BioD-like phosphotransacetylase family protein